MAEIQVRSLDDDAPEVVIKSDKQEETPQEPIQEQAEAQSEEQPQSEEVNEVSIEETQEAPEVQEQVETPTLQIDDESALNYLKEKYKFEGDSLDVLLNNGEEKQQIELTSDVQAFLDYQKETGRGLNDFLELNKDFDSMDDMSLMRAYLKETKPHYDDDDISYHIQKKFVAQDDDAEDYRREKALDYKDELYKLDNSSIRKRKNIISHLSQVILMFLSSIRMRLTFIVNIKPIRKSKIAWLVKGTKFS